MHLSLNVRHFLKYIFTVNIFRLEIVYLNYLFNLFKQKKKTTLNQHYLVPENLFHSCWLDLRIFSRSNVQSFMGLAN